MGKVDDRAANLLRIASSNTDRLVRLINDILDLERMDSGNAPIRLRPCSLRELVLQSVETMSAMAQEVDISLETSSAHHAGTVHLRRRPRPPSAGPDQSALERNQVLPTRLTNTHRNQHQPHGPYGARRGPRPWRSAGQARNHLWAGSIRSRFQTRGKRVAQASVSPSAAASCTSMAAKSGRSATTPACPAAREPPSPCVFLAILLRTSSHRLRPSGTAPSSLWTTTPPSATWSPSTFVSRATKSSRPILGRPPSRQWPVSTSRPFS